MDAVIFLSAPELEWQACLKKTEIELESLANITSNTMGCKPFIWMCYVSKITCKQR